MQSLTIQLGITYCVKRLYAFVYTKATINCSPSIVTVNESVLRLESESTAVYVTEVVPIGKVSPGL